MKDENLPDFTFEGVHLTQFDNGVEKWTISAKRADVTTKTDLLKLQETTGNIYSSNGNKIMFDAVTLNYFIGEKRMEFHVASFNFFIGNKKFDMFSQVLDWDYVQNQFVGHSGVVLKHDNVVILGETFVADLPIKKLTVATKAHARLKVKQ